MELQPFDLALVVSLRGRELGMSKHVLCDTAVKLQPIIKAYTACTSQHKPRRDMQHLIHSQCRDLDSVAHISERHRNALPSNSHFRHN